MSLTSLKPLGSVVLVLPKPAPRPATASGIVLADVADEPETCGLVLAVGAGFQCHACACARPASVKVGDWVVFPRGAGDQIEHGGRTVVLLEEAELLAVVDETAACEVV